MGRPRRIRSAAEMAEKWEAYKKDCDTQKRPVHAFSPGENRFIQNTVKVRITYTIEGFCQWLGISRSAFYDTYEKDKRFSDIVTRAREECELDARRKFETGELPDRLAGLWMAKYGYSERTEEEQQARLDNLRASTTRMQGGEQEGPPPDDGFLDALACAAGEVWRK